MTSTTTRVKTSELIGAALDWVITHEKFPSSRDFMDPYTIEYSTDWASGGPIIAKNKISIAYYPDGGHKDGGEWIASVGGDDTPFQEESGPTALVAAMRCYVASRFGSHLKVPTILL